MHIFEREKEGESQSFLPSAFSLGKAIPW